MIKSARHSNTAAEAVKIQVEALEGINGQGFTVEVILAEGDEKFTAPTEEAEGSYSFTVKISKDGKEATTEELTVKIAKKTE